MNFWSSCPWCLNAGSFGSIDRPWGCVLIMSLLTVVFEIVIRFVLGRGRSACQEVVSPYTDRGVPKEGVRDGSRGRATWKHISFSAGKPSRNPGRTEHRRVPQGYPPGPRQGAGPRQSGTPGLHFFPNPL